MEVEATGAIQIRCLETISDREIQGLIDVLIDCVESGASVGFMLPMPRAKAAAFWHRTSESAMRGERVVLAAEDAAGTIVGTVQVMLNQPENQPHRGDIAKSCHRRVRRQVLRSAPLCRRHVLSVPQDSAGAERSLVGCERLSTAMLQRCGKFRLRTVAHGTPVTTFFLSSCATK